MSYLIASLGLFTDVVIQRVGWILIHGLWQFALLGLVAALLLRWLRHGPARTRYGLLVAIMGTVAMAPVATLFLQPITLTAVRGPAAFNTAPNVGTHFEGSLHGPMDLLPENIDRPETKKNKAAALGLPNSSERQSIAKFPAADVSLRDRLGLALQPWFPWIVGSWLLGVLACSLRPLLGWRMLRRLRTIGVSLPSDDVLAAFERVSKRLGIGTAVQVVNSTIAKGPLVVGYLRPLVLLPVSLVTSIPLSQLEAILAHELAHVRRHDFIVNLFQVLIETLFFYHPAIWWLSRRIRVEREHCCDDLVVRIFDNGAEYGRALLAIEQLQVRTSSSASLALGASDGSILNRIRRIVNTNSDRDVRIFDRWQATFLSLVCLSVVTLLSLNWSAVAEESEPAMPQPLTTSSPTDNPGQAYFAQPRQLTLNQDNAHSPFLKSFRTAANIVGFYLLESNDPTSDSLDLRIVHVANVTTPWGDFDVDGFIVKGKRGAAAPVETYQPIVATAGEPAFVLPDHLNVMAVGFARDDKSLFTVSTEKKIAIRTWDLVKQKLVSQVQLDTEKHANFFLFGKLMLSPDRTQVVSIREGKVEIWNAATGKLGRTFELPAEMQHGLLSGLVCTPDFSRLACGRNAGLGG